jgi:hypothetical protein
MRKVVALMVVGVVAGCGSSSNDPFGPEPNYNAIRAQFDRPTGTFAAGTETGAFSAYNQSQQSSQSYGAMGNLTASGTASGTATQSVGLHILGGASSLGSATDWCPALNNKQTSGSCSCPDGGTFEWDFTGLSSIQQGQPIDVTAKAHFSGCTATPVTVDGSEFLNMQSTSSTPSAADFFMLLDAHLTATIPPDTAKVDLDILYDNGKSWIMFGVNDGQIAVGSDGSFDGTTSTGTVYVKDRQGTWTCTATNGHGTCTADTGQTRSF